MTRYWFRNIIFTRNKDLSETAYDDENESDELENVSQDMKTDHGYLKDGFVVDDNELEYEEYVDES